MREEITRRLIEAVAEQLDAAPGAITPESRFVEDLEADSLGVAELMLQAEEIFDVILEDEEIGSVNTVQDAADLIQRKL